MLEKVLRRWALREEVEFCIWDSEREQEGSSTGLIGEMFYAKFARKFAEPVVASQDHETPSPYLWLFMAAHSGCRLHDWMGRFFSARCGQAAVQ